MIIQVMWPSNPFPVAHGGAPTSCEGELEKNQVQHKELAGKATIILHKSVDVRPDEVLLQKKSFRIGGRDV